MSLLADARLRVRRPTLADARLVVDLINASDRHDYGVEDTDLDDILQEFAEVVKVLREGRDGRVQSLDLPAS